MQHYLRQVSPQILKATSTLLAGIGSTKFKRMGILKIFAGNGGRGAYCGDEGPAQYACLNVPEDVAIDGAGNLYIADRYNHRIRKVDPSGVISTVAGNGSAAFCGDGGPAPQACLDEPHFVAVDPAGKFTNWGPRKCSNSKGRFQWDDFNSCRKWISWFLWGWRARHQRLPN